MLAKLLGALLSIAGLTVQPIEISSSEWRCLSDAVWIESRGEPIEGQRAVAQVILNRVIHPEFPNSVCAVLAQPNQFPWWGNLNARRNTESYQVIRNKSMRWLIYFKLGLPFGPSETQDATFFNGVPFTYARLEYAAQINNHLFFRIRED